MLSCASSRRAARNAVVLVYVCVAVVAGLVPAAGEESPFAPTPEPVVEAMLKAAKAKAQDVVVDLGSGDGRIVIAAAKKFGVRKAIGVEISDNLVRIARERAAKAGVANRVEFRNQDLFDYDFSAATVVTLYLLPEDNLRLRPKLLALKPGSRIVAHQFGLGDWPADASWKALADHDPRGPATVYLWTVPAQLSGVWRWQEGHSSVELGVKQTFQKIQPTLMRDNAAERLEAAELTGDRLYFVAVRAAGPFNYEGRVTGNAIKGSIVGPDGKSRPWEAQRTGS